MLVYFSKRPRFCKFATTKVVIIQHVKGVLAEMKAPFALLNVCVVRAALDRPSVLVCLAFLVLKSFTDKTFVKSLKTLDGFGHLAYPP